MYVSAPVLVCIIIIIIIATRGEFIGVVQLDGKVCTIFSAFFNGIWLSRTNLNYI